ncbi:MAG: hypothetical protein KDA42_00380 [Planctomycetales bacterium]|nr:hypothetical protein [Planctomycetales bacterium]
MNTKHRFALVILVAAAILVRNSQAEEPVSLRIATFATDVTIPLGHRCMGILPTRAQRIDDPLEARGLVLLGGEQPIVVVAVDWCELRNGAYDQWRDALALAAGTSRQRVLVACLHQHDAPVCDRGAQRLLDEVGLPGELYDRAFHDDCVRRVAAALAESVPAARSVTHIGLGEANVEKVASNRRLVMPDGRVTFARYSRSGGDSFAAAAPEGLIDPQLKTICFYNGDTTIAALHSYATHPMSYYGQGGVSADFVGLARRRRQQDDPNCFQIYLTGCSGDVTAGKYNDGSSAMRGVLAERIYRAMRAAEQTARRTPVTKCEFRSATLDLPFHESEAFGRDALESTLRDNQANMRDRILAAMALSSRDRLDSGQAIDLPAVELGDATILLFPGEAFVGYQLLAQRMFAEQFVVAIGYGECWTGYIPTHAAFAERFGHDWRWVGPGCEKRVTAALESLR